jgi:predicted NAD-dependent protein-ADP-ribosyltransferase YbiA (DUF1768 family)
MSTVSALINARKFSLFQNSKWEEPPKDIRRIPLKIFEDTARQLVQDQEKILETTDMKKTLEFLRLFNTAWTTARLAQGIISSPPKQSARPILFSSYSKEYSWLSNFFQTLILDEERRRILPHVESGYVAHKTEASGEPLPQGIFQEMDPRLAKHSGEHIDRPSTAISEMHRLVVLKFSNNPVLESLLLSSGDAPLEEHTSDPFWGTAYGTEGQNHLGHIIESVRHSLQPQ